VLQQSQVGRKATGPAPEPDDGGTARLLLQVVDPNDFKGPIRLRLKQPQEPPPPQQQQLLQEGKVEHV
jgi:hypothetical protein